MVSSKIFDSHQLADLDTTRSPKHVAIIPDGNRRWAMAKHDVAETGHRAGAHTLIEIVKAAKELGIKTITFFVFSTENWNRSEQEIHAFMWLIQEFLKEYCAEMQENGVKLMTIGNLEPLSKEVIHTLEQTKQATANGTCINMVLSLNYGARDEIKRSLIKMIDDCYTNKLKKEEITEAVISDYLDTAPFGDPDLLIRTSGEMRISNFLLWQAAYTELYLTKVMWPDFTPLHLLEAVTEYQKRERRRGT